MGLFDNIKLKRMMQSASTTHASANDLSRRGKPAEAEKKYAEALKLYREAYDAGARTVDGLMSYAVLLMRLGDFTEARKIMKETAAQGKTLTEDAHFELRINYAICLWRLGELDEAIKTAAYAGRHIKNSSYYSALGTFLVEKAGISGDFEAAKTFLDEAMEYDDEDAATLDNYGEYYDRLGQKLRAEGDIQAANDCRAKSVEYYEKALKRKPSQVSTLYALARFAKEDGNSARTKELVDRALLHLSSKVCPVTSEMLHALIN